MIGRPEQVDLDVIGSVPSRGKRARTRATLLANAIALFRQQGVRATRLSEVAAASGISPATLYNHFPTKGALAEAWVRGEAEARVAVAASQAVEQGRSLRSALRQACSEIARAASDEPVLRLEAWRETGRAPGAPSVDRDALIAGLREEQKREHVRSDVPAETLAVMLLDAIEGGLVAGLAASVAEEVSGADAVEASLVVAVRARVDLVLDGARKRNERVRLPARSR